MKQVNVKKLILPNIPYVFIALLATKVSEAVRLAPGSDASTKLLNIMTGLNTAFHSLRHSSTTYKLKLNHGDIKATQGDTGHSQADMVTKVYAHILDEDRKVNAQKFESAFYANPDLRSVKAPDEPQTALDVQSIIVQLQQSPELLSALTSLISNQGCK